MLDVPTGPDPCGVPALAPDWFTHHAAGASGAKVALIDTPTGRRWTYRELDTRLDALAGALASLGVTAGDRVCVLAANSPHIFEVQFACQRLGAIFVPLNWRLARPELRAIVADCRPRVVLADDLHLNVGAALAADSGLTILDWRRDGAASSYEVAIASAEHYSAIQPFMETPTALLYTSGTTGRPKGVIYNHRMLTWNAILGNAAYTYDADMTNLVTLPMFHAGGLSTFGSPAFYYGGTNVVLGSTSPDEILAALTHEHWEVTHYMGVPALYQAMAQLAEFNDADLTRTRVCGVGGASMPTETLSTWLERGVAIQQVYAMTETGVFVMAQSRAEAPSNLGSAGRPGLGVLLSLRDPNGKVVSPGEVGELWVKSPCITPGYWANPDATHEAFVDGWLRTGDSLRRRENGHYEVVGRSKDMYISGGENVYPAEIENALYELDGVLEAAVIGVPHERWGEVGEAYVVELAGLGDRATIYRDFFGERLAKYKRPQRVHIVAQLPRTGIGKIAKHDLRNNPSAAIQTYDIWA